jgi:thiamine biosynthesis lipoprotein
MKKFVLIAAVFLTFLSCQKSSPKYIKNSGLIFGTYYQLTYQSAGEEDYHSEVKELLNKLDHSFSTYNPNSSVSKTNKNLPHEPDTLFNNVFKKSQEIAALTNGAFDATVAPLVNAWGFGFTKKESITPELIDSIKQFVGFEKVRLENKLVVKTDDRLKLDFSAIAKGYSVDIVAEFLHEIGCENYLVDIGGEVVAYGQNPSGKTWRVGVNEPNDNEPMTPNSLQAVVSLKNRGMATSGNYRNFYIEDGKKYAHTIDPRNGYPVNHNLLSATIVAHDCMTADALATACMVLGIDSARLLIEKIDNVEAFFIYSEPGKQNQLFITDGFQKMIINE